MVLGLYAARLAGEAAGLPNWIVAAGMSAVLALGLGWLLSRRPLRRTWPALVLFVYVVYPEPDLALGLFVGAVALLTWSQVVMRSRSLSAGRWVRLGSVAGVAAAALWLYVRTVAPDVLPADSGELQVVAATLGVAHPPGFPLYVMLGNLWTRLPIGAGPAFRLNLFSAVTSTLTLVLVYLTVLSLARLRPVMAGWIAAVALGTATTFWAQATTANIRSLTGLFTALALYCLVRFGQSTVAESTRPRADRWLVAAALALGFGVTHHVSLAFLAALAVVYVLLADRTLIHTPRRWLWPIVAGLAGLLPLLYLPLRANSGARGATPQLATVSGFLEHVLATGFRGDLFYFTDLATFWERLRIMGNILTFQFVPVLLLGMAVGLALMLRRDRLTALLIGGTAAVFTLVAATYRAPQTVEYMMPAYVALALALGYAAGRLPWSTGKAGRVAWAGSQLFGALLLVSGLNQGWQRFGSYDALHQDTTARDVAGGLLAEAPPGSTLLAHWHWVTPMWYLQEVEGQRPDVAARFVFPEGEVYAATWARRTAEAYAAGQPVVTTFYDRDAFAGLPPPRPIGEAYLFAQGPLMSLPEGYEPLSIILGDRLELVGYRQEKAAVQAGDGLVLTVAWRPIGVPPENLSFFAHLMGPDGRIYGQGDVPALPPPDGLTLTQLRVVPRPGTPLGTLVLAVGAYDPQPLVDAAGEARVPISNAAVIPADLPPFTQQPLARRELSAAGRQMIGYDWDETLPDRPRLYLHWRSNDGYWTEVRDNELGEDGQLTDLPPYRGLWGVPAPFWRVPLYSGANQYVPLGAGITWTGETLSGGTRPPGETWSLDQTLHADRPVLRDYVVSTRLIGLEGDGPTWAWWDLQDAVPGLGAVPTLKWIHGSRVLTPAMVTVPPGTPPGQQLTGALTLYDAFTNRPLPILDERLTDAYGWVPLGGATVGQ